MPSQRSASPWSRPAGDRDHVGQRADAHRRRRRPVGAVADLALVVAAPADDRAVSTDRVAHVPAAGDRDSVGDPDDRDRAAAQRRRAVAELAVGVEPPRPDRPVAHQGHREVVAGLDRGGCCSAPGPVSESSGCWSYRCRAGPRRCCPRPRRCRWSAVRSTCSRPPCRSTTSSSPGTAPGVSRAVVVPLPSCPKEFAPQVHGALGLTRAARASGAAGPPLPALPALPGSGRACRWPQRARPSCQSATSSQESSTRPAPDARNHTGGRHHPNRGSFRPSSSWAMNLGPPLCCRGGRRVLMASTRFSHLRPARSALWCATAVAALVVGTPLTATGRHDAGSRHGSRGPAAGCSGRGRGTAEHLLLQPRRPARRLPGRDRPAAVHAQDQSVDGGRPPLHADVRRRPFVLPVPVVADDRPLPAQQRGAQPAGRTAVRRRRTRWPATCVPPATRPTWTASSSPPGPRRRCRRASTTRR